LLYIVPELFRMRVLLRGRAQHLSASYCGDEEVLDAAGGGGAGGGGEC
jgi:hypothetical protein